MRSHHAPASREAYPGLHLAADLSGHGRAMEQRRGDGGVATVGGDDRARERAGKACGRARRTEGFDFGISKQILAAAEPDGARVIVEHGIERSDIVCYER